LYEKDFSKLAVSTDFYPAYASLATEANRKKELGLAADYLDLRWYNQAAIALDSKG